MCWQQQPIKNSLLFVSMFLRVQLPARQLDAPALTNRESQPGALFFFKLRIRGGREQTLALAVCLHSAIFLRIVVSCDLRPLR
jgi:hypothetical protein